MHMRSRQPLVISAATAAILIGSAGRARPSVEPAVDSTMDRDLIEVMIPAPQAMYAAKKYTVAQVTAWYLKRIALYDGVYRAVLHVDAAGANATAAAEDRAARDGGARFTRGPLWGVP